MGRDILRVEVDYVVVLLAYMYCCTAAQTKHPKKQSKLYTYMYSRYFAERAITLHAERAIALHV